MTDENGNNQHDENRILDSLLVPRTSIPPLYIIFDRKNIGCHMDHCIADVHITITSVDSVSLATDYCDTFILSAQTCMLFLNGIGSCIGRDSFLNYGEYCLIYNASSFNASVMWHIVKETDEQEK